MRSKGISRANENRAIRQKALREQIASQKHEQHVVEMVNKITDLGSDLTQMELKRLEVALNAKFKLMNKYIPDLSHATIAGDEESPLKGLLVQFDDRRSNTNDNNT